MSAAPPFRGVSHLALSVRDLPAAVAFWRDVMGFEVFTDRPGLAFVGHRATRLGIGLTDHGGAVRDGFSERRTGLDHLALAVSSAAELDAWAARLAALGVPHSPVADSGDGLHLNLRAPDDVPVELYVMAPETAAAFGLDPTEPFAVTP
jgi:glyoxylase I family protein